MDLINVFENLKLSKKMFKLILKLLTVKKHEKTQVELLKNPKICC